MLELAITLDLSERFDQSAAIAEQARRRLTALPEKPRALEIDLELAEARTYFRRNEPGRAVPRLRAVIAGARELGRWETVTIAGLLLGVSLVPLQELDDAEVAFAELIELCQERDDRFHLAAALANRMWLWSARGEIQRSEQETRAVIQLSREGGQPHLERAATHNLAEALLWRGALDEALPLARRSLQLQRGHGEGTATPDLLLISRILAAKRDLAELAATLSQLDLAELGTDEQILHRAVTAVASDADRATWSELVAESASLAVGYELEIALLAARCGRLDGPQRDGAIARARENPVFAGRVSEF
jgi:tetratricopeptide (TPR) repeat protein